jgi:FdhE protein
MPLVTVDVFSREELLAEAGRRWDLVRHERPDLTPALELQQQLLTVVMDLTDAIEGSRLPRLSMPPKYLATKLGRGVPMFAGEPLPLPVGLLKTALLRLCVALAAGGAGESADHIHAALENGSMDAGSLLSASISRDQQAIRTGAVYRGLAPDLVWLVAELATGPFAHALQHALIENATDAGLVAARDAWNQGYCPVCGSWPALAEFAGGRRVLRCSFCAAGWDLKAYRCIYCGADGKDFVTAAPDEERKNRRLEVCASCTSYLKTIDVEALSPFPLVAIADMETMDLDLAAMEHGYRRPPLKEFKLPR